MKFHTVLLLLLLIGVSAFTALNWNLFTSPSELSLGLTTIQMPLGLVMLGLLVFVTAIFLALIVYLQGSVLLEARRHSKEIRSARELADQAEASRFNELRTYLESAANLQKTQCDAAAASLLERIDRLDGDMRVAVEEFGNSLASYVGELEDRLEKGSSPAS